ncbi:hypothetical protein [Chitinophaga defluvii]|uniref:YtxH-like protein n=1 Tax=Chitinophaga defluvii TaxID=3163343 RepID=A0ABV2TES7_9BACT
MKKILIAASVVGTAAAGLIIYLKNRDKADKLLERAKEAARKTTRRLNNNMHQVNGKATQLWSNSMG